MFGSYPTGSMGKVRPMHEPVSPINLYDPVGLFGGVGAMRFDGMRRWEGSAWSMESHSGSRAENALAFLRR